MSGWSEVRLDGSVVGCVWGVRTCVCANVHAFACAYVSGCFTQCSGGCESGLQTRAVRCIDSDSVLSEHCSGSVPLPYRFCQVQEECVTPGQQ